jgi:hypothetical protein
MDKQRERLQLRRVFGERASNAHDHERPDFLLRTDGCPTLGIEVTTVYASNADAKLKLIPGYTESLISKSRRVHRADAANLRVEDATLLNPDGSVVDKITGIFQEMPSKNDAYEMLFSRIDEKHEKIDEYMASCDEVDLIVEDGSSLFRHQTHEEFYRLFHALAPRSQLIKSRFREIYLITNTVGLQSVYIPLIANVFFADCFAYEHLLRPSIEADRPSWELFQVLAACLWHGGYESKVVIASGSEGIGMFCGAWELFYAADGKKLCDWSLPTHPYEGESLVSFLSGTTPELIEEARALSQSRADWFAAMDVRLPTHEA